VLFDHIRFCVEDAAASRNWFVQRMGFTAVASEISTHTHTEVIQSGLVVFVLTSPRDASSPAAQFLSLHPPGVEDVVLRVADVEVAMSIATAAGAKVSQPIQVATQAGTSLKWSQIVGWGGLKHTLVERSGVEPLGTPFLLPSSSYGVLLPKTHGIANGFIGIDHVVLNVAKGDLEPAVAWYQTVLGLEPQQQFTIATPNSALYSRVLNDATGTLKLPINEPASGNSQVQEFLNLHRGAGIQHIALQADDVVTTVAHLRSAGLNFLAVPEIYYDEVRQRSGSFLTEQQLQSIAAQEILVDWQADVPALLLQTFTQPIFAQPTFFFEVIERQVYWLNGQAQSVQGFGEMNFRALFEAIEREQLKRGSL